MIAIVSGTIGRSVTGGQAWATLQYLLGLRDLGYRVVYLEDSGTWSSVYDWEAGQNTSDIDHPSAFIRATLAPFGLDDWIYRAGDDCRGMPLEAFTALCHEADLFLVRAVPLFLRRPEYDAPYRKAFLDVDPGFTQIKLAMGGAPALRETLARMDRAFSFGTRIGSLDCTVPSAGVEWVPTLPPVVLGEWPPEAAPPDAPITSVMRWQGMEDLTLGHLECGQRDREFPAFEDLPRETGARFRLAALGAPEARLLQKGWDVVHGHDVTATAPSYQSFIRASLAELGIAKHCYVHHRTGWISDRSACYLATGRPVLAQDTGAGGPFDGPLGFLPFTDAEGAAARVRQLREDYPSHARAARTLAEDVLDSSRVLRDLLGSIA